MPCAHSRTLVALMVGAACVAAAPGSVSVVDPANFVGEHPSFAEVNGVPAISYYDIVNKDLKFVRAAADSPFGDTWETPVVLDDSGFVGTHSTLIVTAGNPAVAFFDESSEAVKFLRATDSLGDTWPPAASVVNTTGSTDGFLSAATIDGVPTVAYVQNQGGSSAVMFSRGDAAAGESWGPASVVATVDAQYLSLADVDGRPAIAFYASSSRDLVYVSASSASGDTWNTPVTVASTGDSGAYASLAAVDGLPAILYRALLQATYVRAVDADGAAWGTPVALDGSVNVNTGVETSLAVVDGKPFAAWLNVGTNTLRFAWATDAIGGSWPGATVLGFVQSGGFVSVGQVSGAFPGVAFYDDNALNLKWQLAEYPSPSPSPTTSPSSTPSPSHSSSPSPSATPSPSQTATPSATPSQTPTSSATPSATPSPSASPSATPSQTPPPTTSPSPSPTPSPSSTHSPSSTPSSSMTPSSTATPSASPSSSLAGVPIDGFFQPAPSPGNSAVGVSIGAVAGVLFIVGCVALFVVHRRRRQTAAAAAKLPIPPALPGGVSPNANPDDPPDRVRITARFPARSAVVQSNPSHGQRRDSEPPMYDPATSSRRYRSASLASATAAAAAAAVQENLRRSSVQSSGSDDIVARGNSGRRESKRGSATSVQKQLQAYLDKHVAPTPTSAVQPEAADAGPPAIMSPAGRRMSAPRPVGVERAGAVADGLSPAADGLRPGGPGGKPAVHDIDAMFGMGVDPDGVQVTVPTSPKSPEWI